MDNNAWQLTSFDITGLFGRKVLPGDRNRIQNRADRLIYSNELPVFEQVGKMFQMTPTTQMPHSLDNLCETIAYRAAELMQVDYSRLILRERGGKFTCRANFYVSPAVHCYKPKNTEPVFAEQVYQKVLMGNCPVLVENFDPRFSPDERKALGMKGNDSICLAPMIAGEKQIGIIIFGHTPKSNLDKFWEEKLGLATIAAGQAANTIHMASLTQELEKNRLETVLALLKAIEARDQYTSLHGKKITEYAVKLAKKFRMSKDDVQTLRNAALLHDIGKIGVPDHILYKPGPLTEEEWEVMKQHPVIGAEIVLNVTNLADVASIIHSHHEKYDGSGYPDGLKGDKIPFGARILALVDAYSVMMDQRMYQPTLEASEAALEIKKCSGTHFDPAVVEMFLSLVKI